MKLELCEIVDIEEVVDVINSTEIGEKYFTNDVDRIRSVIQNEQKKLRVSILRNEDNTLIGTLVHYELGAFGKYPYIHMIAVAPAFQNQGFGKKMLGLYEKERIEAGEKLFLLVAEWNERAKKLYESIGYKELGRIDGFYITDQVEILMMKSS